MKWLICLFMDHKLIAISFDSSEMVRPACYCTRCKNWIQ